MLQSTNGARGIDDMRVDVERRRDARVPEALLGDLDRHAQVVEQRRANVAELTLSELPRERRSDGSSRIIAEYLYRSDPHLAW